MSDIYLSLTETPSVVTLSQPVIASSVAATVTVGNTVTVALDSASLAALENVTVTVGAAVTVAGFSTSSLPPSTVTVGNSVTIGNFPSTQTIAGTVTANVPLSPDAWAGNDGIRVVGNGSDGALRIGGYDPIYGGQLNLEDGGGIPVFAANQAALPISGTVTAAAPNGSLTTRFGTPTTANVSFATSAVTNANRKYLLIQNVTTGSNVITVGIGFTPTTTQGIQLTAGAGITFESSYIPTGAVYVLSSVTASNFTILEA